MKRGTLVVVVTAMVLLLGITAATRVPIQMIPDLDTRVISINVIPLAGVAFAIGMTIDNTIVMLESIQQEYHKGKSRFQAALDGTKNVAAAVLSGTMTTILVFLPLLFVKEEAVQLFSDIGIAISASILVSMLTALTLVPVACANLPAKGLKTKDSVAKGPKRLLLGPIEWLIGGTVRRLVYMAALLLVMVGVLVFLTPSAEYLPEGEEAKSFSSMIAPPGYNLPQMEKIAHRLQEEIMPSLDHDPEDFDNGDLEIPPLARFTIIVQTESLRIIAETKDPKQIEAFMEVINERLKAYPGMRSFSARGSIISSNDGGTRAVALNISGSDLAEIYEAATLTYRRAEEVIQDAQINSEPPSLVLGQPLLEIRPRWERLSELGFDSGGFGFAVASLTDGAFVDEFFLEDDKVDIFLYDTAINEQKLDRIQDFTLHSPQGSVVPLSTVADIVETVDSARIRRVDGRRTVTLYIVPPRSVPLETAVEVVRQDVVGHLRESGELPEGIAMDLTGASDQLDATRASLGSNMWIALVLCYLQLVIIYRHWGDPFLILATVPIGISGGIAGLWLLNFVGGMLPAIGLAEIRQPFDMITMLGFLILLGTSVNNPILIVDRAMHNRRKEGMSPEDSVKDAVASRLRPVVMTTSTTIMGLAPLVFLAGAGTELYRGVGAIVLFGLACTAFVTLTFLPALLVTVMKFADVFRKKEA